jgi:hypothetical protein
MGAKNHGYGLFWTGKRKVLAHRWAYEFFISEIPPGLQIDHLCRNPSCVNPWHLEPVTGLVNILRSDGITARYARSTHCARGHELTDIGTRRRCLTCHAASRAKRAAASRRTSKEVAA